MPILWQQDDFFISADPALLQPGEIHAYLTRSYWATGRSLEAVERSLEHSLCLGLYHGARQIGLCRIVSDFTIFAYLCDVYVLEEYRGQGLGKQLIAAAVAYPELQTVRRWMLATRDAHGLYSQYGFSALSAPERWMERFLPPPAAPQP